MRSRLKSIIIMIVLLGMTQVVQAQSDDILISQSALNNVIDALNNEIMKVDLILENKPCNPYKLRRARKNLSRIQINLKELKRKILKKPLVHAAAQSGYQPAKPVQQQNQLSRPVMRRHKWIEFIKYLKEQKFDDDKQALLESVVSHWWFTTSQVKEILMEYSITSSKIKVLKLLSANSNQQIKEFNKLFDHNAQKLKSGSFAVYEITESIIDKKTRKVLRSGSVTEKWQVVDLKSGHAVVKVSPQGQTAKNESYENKKQLYRNKIDVNHPETCLYWKAFAEKIKKGSDKINGKYVKTLFRSQTMLGNILPEYTYGYNIPFNIVEEKTTTTLKDNTRVRIKRIRSFKF